MCDKDMAKSNALWNSPLIELHDAKKPWTGTDGSKNGKKT
jgi:hypothetical protein